MNPTMNPSKNSPETLNVVKVPVLTPKQMSELDRRAIEERGIPARTLMEAAGRAVFDEIQKRQPKQLVILAGPGNNGGDGFVVARLAAEAGFKPTILAIHPDMLPGAAGECYRDYVNRFGVVDKMAAATEVLREVDCIVDALFGTGLARKVEGEAQEWIEAANQNHRAWKVAVDIPSGLDGETGQVLGAAFKADVTITFQCPKTGFFTAQGPSQVGRLVIADIGIPVNSVGTQISAVTRFDLASLLRRDRASFKNRYGHITLIGGSPGMTGANVLAARAAFRVGAGLVTAVFPQSSIRQYGKKFVPDLMISELKDRKGIVSSFSKEFVKNCEARDAIGVGCGLKITASALQSLLMKISVPVIIDAGALAPFQKLAKKKRKALIIVTPHPGEFAKLTGISKNKIAERRIDCARQFAIDTRITVVLKGAFSVIASPDGEVIVNTSGNPGMATAGMGDALTGILTSLVGQKLELKMLDQVALAVWLHGAVGDLAAAKMTETSLMASDLIDMIPAYLQSQGVR